MSEIVKQVRERVGAWLDALSPDETGPGVDKQFLRATEYRYMTIGVETEHGERARCDLCGEYYQVEDAPQLIEHVAGHDDQGQAEVDPFETRSLAEPTQEAKWEI